MSAKEEKKVQQHGTSYPEFYAKENVRFNPNKEQARIGMIAFDLEAGGRLPEYYQRSFPKLKQLPEKVIKKIANRTAREGEGMFWKGFTDGK